jgi:hypothetical protein
VSAMRTKKSTPANQNRARARPGVSGKVRITVILA